MPETFEGGMPPQERKEKDIPSEFLYHIALKSVPDRHGTVGTINVNVDWRPEYIEFGYNEVLLVPELQTFLDDHRRSFNNQIARGGRDMRKFSISDQEIKEKRKELKAKLEGEKNALTKQLADQIPAARITVERKSESKTSSGRDAEGERWSQTDHYLILTWSDDRGSSVSSTPIASLEISVPDPELGKDVTKEERYIQELQRGNNTATLYLRKRLAELKAAEATPEIKAAKERLRAVCDALVIIRSTIDLGIPVYLAPETMPDEERNQRIKKAQSESPYNRLRTEYKTTGYPMDLDTLSKYGVVGTEKFYRERHIDLQAETIDFKSP